MKQYWQVWEDEIKKGKDGGLCKLEIRGVNGHEVQIRTGTGKEFTWQFTKYDDKWLLTKIIVQ
jgi:hypothetical protein